MLDIFEYIESRGIQVIRDDGSELACYCPFHSNMDTPAFYVNKTTGLWICFNPSCGKTGSIRDLMEFFGDHGKIVKDYSLDDIQKNLVYTEDAKEDNSWDEALDSIRLSLPEDLGKVQYLLDRGFSEETISYFDIAFSDSKKRIVIPARNERHKVIGFIGRTTQPDVQPKYLYSKGFPRKNILFNLNNAKKYSSCIVVEGSLDALKIHQAGFPNVVASLGATITEGHISLLNKYFDTIIVFSDNDNAGHAMRDEIVSKCYGKNMKIVEFADSGLKDPGEMTAEQISEYLDIAQDYFTWRFDDVLSSH
jgi:DNA primase